MSECIDITGRTQCYVPYDTLESSPVTLLLSEVPITLTMTHPHTCLVSVPPRFVFTDSEAPGRHVSSPARLGTSFLVAYKGSECEVRLGRRITVLDSDTNRGVYPL